MQITCDALLPTHERYSSLKFRRYSRWFRPTKLSWDEALELVTFVESIGGVKFAAYVFHWGHAGVRAYIRLARHVGDDAQPYIRDNLASTSVDDGLAVLQAMRDGGWVSHGLPKLVRHALASLKHEGMKVSAIAKLTGLTVDQVIWAVKPKSHGRTRAYASLGTGTKSF
jgi:hypothetical protein